MKRFIKLVLFLPAIYLIYIVISLSILPPVSDLANRKYTTTIQVKDWQGTYHPFVIGPRNRYWTNSAQIPPEMKWAVILAEDSNFYKHEGVDVKAIKQAIKYDLEKKSFARGASTITQQTAKNVFLSREKTITRKLKEIYLAWRMEQELTKGRIVELYLNVVELGPLVHGVGHGSQYYFGKPAADLTPRECAFLAAMLPGPRVAYNPYKNLNKVLKRSNMILKLMRQKGVLSSAEYQAALAQSPNVGRMQQKVDQSIKQDVVFNNLSSQNRSALRPDEVGELPEAKKKNEVEDPTEEKEPAEAPPQKTEPEPEKQSK